MSDWPVPAALFVKWLKAAQVDPAIKPVRVIYATPASKEELAALKAERKEKERRHLTRVVSLRLIDRTGSTASTSRR